jgi:hypothetical protein
LSAGLFSRDRCTALVITCSDFRFKSAERAFAEQAGIVDDYDLIARPGAIRALVAPRSVAARDAMRDDIRLLWSLHHFSRVLMLNHVSCRAYDDLATPQNEVAVHTDHLLQAKPLIEAMFEGVRGEPYLVDLVFGRLEVRAL